MSIYHQLQSVYEAHKGGRDMAQAEADQTASENLDRALRALGLEPGYIAGGVYEDSETATTITLVGGVVSEHTTVKGTHLSFALDIEAPLLPEIRDQYREEVGQAARKFKERRQFGVYETADPNSDHYNLPAQQLELHSALTKIIGERNNWLIAWMSRDSEPEPESDLTTALSALARLLKPYLDALEG